MPDWLQPFNRTIVELKYEYGYFEVYFENPFNRTIVELKW